MTSVVFDKELALTYLRVAELQRLLSDTDKKLIGSDFHTMRDGLRAQFDHNFLSAIDESYNNVLRGYPAENEIQNLVPLGNLQLPDRVFLSEETYVLMLEFLSAQLLYIFSSTKCEGTLISNYTPLESWSNKRYFDLVDKLKSAFEKDGVSFDVFKHNESLGDNDEYEDILRKLINVYFPVSAKKYLPSL